MDEIKNQDGRQYADVAYVEISAAEFTAAGNVIDLMAPPNSELVLGAINVVEAFDGVTTDVVKVGDSLNTARYLANTTIKAVARTALVPTGFVMDDSATGTRTLRITRTPTGGNADAVGKLRVALHVVKLGRSKFTQD